MAWPSAGYTLGDSEAEADEARSTWAAVARAVARFEPVTVVVDRADEMLARDWLGDHVDVVTTPLDDAWMRDIGPTFVVGRRRRARRGRLGVQRVGRAVVGDLGQGHQGRVVRGGPGGRDPHPVRPGQRGRRHPRRRAGHRAAHRDRAARPGPQPRPHPGRRRGRDGAHHRCHDLHLAAPRARPATTTSSAPAATSTSSRPSPRRASCCCTGRATPRTPTTRCRSSSKGCCRRRATRAASRSRWCGAGADDARRRRGPVDWSYINHLVVNGGVVACTYDDPQDADSLAVLERAYPAGRSSASTRGRSSPAAAASTASPSSSRASEPRVPGPSTERPVRHRARRRSFIG